MKVLIVACLVSLGGSVFASGNDQSLKSVEGSAKVQYAAENVTRKVESVLRATSIPTKSADDVALKDMLVCEEIGEVIGEAEELSLSLLEFRDKLSEKQRDANPWIYSLPAKLSETSIGMEGYCNAGFEDQKLLRNTQILNENAKAFLGFVQQAHSVGPFPR